MKATFAINQTSRSYNITISRISLLTVEELVQLCKDHNIPMTATIDIEPNITYLPYYNSGNIVTLCSEPSRLTGDYDIEKYVVLEPAYHVVR